MTTANNSQLSAPIPVSRWVTFIAITVIGCLLDLYTKFAMLAWRGMEGEKPDYWIIENYVGIQVALNEGALFGMGKGYGMVFAGLSVIAIGGICYWLFFRRAAHSWFLTISLGSVAAGILGNLYDRLGLWSPPGSPGEYRDEVRDWILLRWGDAAYTWPNFNIADCFLVCGAIMLMVFALLAREPEEPAKSNEKKGNADKAAKASKRTSANSDAAGQDSAKAVAANHPHNVSKDRPRNKKMRQSARFVTKPPTARKTA